jgi:hypothetical protein
VLRIGVNEGDDAQDGSTQSPRFNEFELIAYERASMIMIEDHD